MRKHHRRLKKLEGDCTAVMEPRHSVIYNGDEQTVDEVREEYRLAGNPLPDHTLMIALVSPEMDEIGRAC